MNYKKPNQYQCLCNESQMSELSSCILNGLGMNAGSNNAKTNQEQILSLPIGNESIVMRSLENKNETTLTEWYS